jgi:hypothetical protein
MEKIKTRLSVDGPVASVKGKSEALERRTARSLSNDLASMDMGNGEDHMMM